MHIWFTVGALTVFGPPDWLIARHTDDLRPVVRSVSHVRDTVLFIRSVCTLHYADYSELCAKLNKSCRILNRWEWGSGVSTEDRIKEQSVEVLHRHGLLQLLRPAAHSAQPPGERRLVSVLRRLPLRFIKWFSFPMLTRRFTLVIWSLIAVVRSNVPLIGSLVTHVRTDDVLLNKNFFHTSPNHAHGCPFRVRRRRTMHSAAPCLGSLNTMDNFVALFSESRVRLHLCWFCPQGDSVHALPTRGLSGSPGVSPQLSDHDLWHHRHASGQRLPARRGHGCCRGHAALPQVFPCWSHLI